MPFVAKRKDTGERVDITALEQPKAVLKSGDCVCQLCEEPLIVKSHFFRRGYYVHAHFAHYNQCESNYESHPESAEHLIAKALLRDELKLLYSKYAEVRIELEVPVPMAWRAKGRQADLMVIWPMGWREVHEIQLASISLESLEERTNDYVRSGIDVTWWLGRSADTYDNREWCIERFGESLRIDFEDQERD